MAEILREQGVYRRQRVPTSRASRSIRAPETTSPIIESAILQISEDELPVAVYHKPPKVDRMTVRIERGGSLFRLFLNFSQVERAVIKEYGLDKLVIEQEPIHSKQEIAEMKTKYDAAVARETDRKRKAQMRNTYNEMLRIAQSQSTDRYIADFMGYPYERRFATALEATEYSDRLQRILQQFQAKLVTYLNQSEGESVEFVEDDEDYSGEGDDDDGDYEDDDE